MTIKADENTPFVNAGLFIQKEGQDITIDLLKEFNWWKDSIKKEEIKHHDEQGALAISLTKYKINNSLCILPKNKYMLIGPNENNDIENIPQDLKLSWKIEIDEIETVEKLKEYWEKNK
jgi:hypothetical protein